MEPPIDPGKPSRVRCAACDATFTPGPCAPGDDVVCTVCGETVSLGPLTVEKHRVRRSRAELLELGHSPATEGSGTTGPTTQVICAQCGVAFEETAAEPGALCVCPRCGFEVEVGERVHVSRRRAPPRRRSTPRFGLMLVVGLVLLFFVLLLFTDLHEYIDWFDRADSPPKPL